MTQALATLSDLATLPGVPAAALATISTPVKQAALDAASERALGMIGGRFKRPLVSWEQDLRHVVCQLATYWLLVDRGFNPVAGGDPNIRLMFQDALSWLTQVARQEISPNIVGAADQSPGFDNPRIISQPSQGWKGRAIR
jgi:phage gp36-like protein